MDKETQLLLDLYAKLRYNVESRSKAPKWLINQLNDIADLRGDFEVLAGNRYGENINYEKIDIEKVRKKAYK